MSQLKIALLQMTACGTDQDDNRRKGETFCRQAAQMGADIALFPEMWSNGYDLPDPAQPDAVARWAAQAVGPDDPFVEHFKALARELDMAIGLTYLERWDGAPRNTFSLIDRHGAIVLTYAKVHTCEFDWEAAVTPGDGFPVAALDTAQGAVRIGAMICFDREFPESARLLMLGGAEIILVPNACTLEDNRLIQFRTRAMENMLGVAMTNYAAPQNNGHSVAYDGIAFEPDETSREMKLIEAGEAEGVFLAVFDLARLRDYRQREAWGNAYRRPRLYGALLDKAVEPPFQRDNARR